MPGVGSGPPVTSPLGDTVIQGGGLLPDNQISHHACVHQKGICSLYEPPIVPFGSVSVHMKGPCHVHPSAAAGRGASISESAKTPANTSAALANIKTRAREGRGWTNCLCSTYRMSMGYLLCYQENVWEVRVVIDEKKQRGSSQPLQLVGKIQVFQIVIPAKSSIPLFLFK